MSHAAARPRFPWASARHALLVAGLALVPVSAGAQLLDLSITPSSFTFPSADPDVTPIVSAPPLTVTYRIRQNARGGWVLTMRAGGDLAAGGATIPIANVTWVATPSPPFQNGTVNASIDQQVASGTGNVAAAQTATITFHLVNSWSYSVGLYTQTLTFTLTAP